MKKFMKRYGWALWLGASLGVAGVTFLRWEYYIIAIPTVILVEWGVNP